MPGHMFHMIEIAFVFSADMLEEFWVDFAGMTHVFFTRAENHSSFSSVVAESYPNRIWFSTLGIQENVKKMMTCKRQQQLCQKSATTTLSLECWRYITRRLSHHVAPIPFSKTITKVQNFSDLSMMSKSTIHNYSIIRIMSHTAIEAAREVFGYTFGVGSRNFPPRKGAPKKVLEAGNKVSLVDVPIMHGHETFKEKVPNERIDLAYEGLTRSLSIRIKYSGFLAENPRITEVLHFPQPVVRQAETIPVCPRIRAKAIATGTSFVYNGEQLLV
jgi:hypothetical protein